MDSCIITGDGTYQNTQVLVDDTPIEYTKLLLRIGKDFNSVVIENDRGEKEYILVGIVINGVYKIIGGGRFTNTKVFYLDEVMRGVQEIQITIFKGYPTDLVVRTVLLPHIIDLGETVRVKNESS